jgi:DNA-directed RNA polymerase subunit RPC12/RpoP
MLEELTCPKCNYKTPFYTCMQCGSTIKIPPPELDGLEGLGEPYSVPTDTFNPVNDEGAPEQPEWADELKLDEDFDQGVPLPSSSNKKWYRTPLSAVRNAFIVLGLVFTLLTIKSILIEFDFISNGLNPRAVYSMLKTSAQ